MSTFFTPNLRGIVFCVLLHNAHWQNDKRSPCPLQLLQYKYILIYRVSEDQAHAAAAVNNSRVSVFYHVAINRRRRTWQQQ